MINKFSEIYDYLSKVSEDPWFEDEPKQRKQTNKIKTKKKTQKKQRTKKTKFKTIEIEIEYTLNKSTTLIQLKQILDIFKSILLLII